MGFWVFGSQSSQSINDIYVCTNIIEQNPYIDVSASFKAESWGEGHTRELVAWAGGSQVRGSRFFWENGGGSTE